MWCNGWLLLFCVQEDENCGASMAVIRDINLDAMDGHFPDQTIYPLRPSVDDMVVGCPQSDLYGSPGRVMVWYMDAEGGKRKSYSLLPLYPDYDLFEPPFRAQESYGTSLVAINDADSNGIDDFMVGAPGGSGEIPGTGRLVVIFLHRERYIGKKFPWLRFWLVRLVPSGFFFCAIVIALIVFCLKFRRQPDAVEMAIKNAGVEVGLQRKRIKKEKIKVQAIYSDDYD
jgi:hypothetical protein